MSTVQQFHSHLPKCPSAKKSQDSHLSIPLALSSFHYSSPHPVFTLDGHFSFKFTYPAFGNTRTLKQQKTATSRPLSFLMARVVPLYWAYSVCFKWGCAIYRYCVCIYIYIYTHTHTHTHTHTEIMPEFGI